MTLDAASLPPAEQDAYERASRWASIRQRQAAHDGAVVVDAYFVGYLAGMRDEVADSADAAQAPRKPQEGDETVADDMEKPSDVVPSLGQVVVRAKVEGYADGQHWREPAKLGGLVRLAAYYSGKSARRFAAEDLMRTPRRVRRMLKYQEDVEESVSTELLRRFHTLRAPDSDATA